MRGLFHHLERERHCMSVLLFSERDRKLVLVRPMNTCLLFSLHLLVLITRAGSSRFGVLSLSSLTGPRLMEWVIARSVVIMQPGLAVVNMAKSRDILLCYTLTPGKSYILMNSAHPILLALRVKPT